MPEQKAGPRCWRGGSWGPEDRGAGEFSLIVDEAISPTHRPKVVRHWYVGVGIGGQLAVMADTNKAFVKDHPKQNAILL